MNNFGSASHKNVFSLNSNKSEILIGFIFIKIRSTISREDLVNRNLFKNNSIKLVIN